MAVKDNAELKDLMNVRLAKFESIISNMDEKRGKIFLNWMKDHNNYLEWETRFKPNKLRKYNRSEIVFVNFGFNTGSEIGGYHYAVIMDDNEKTNPVVNVVPMGSLDADQSEDVLHKDELLVGVIPGLNDKRAFLIPNQFQPISKLRIVRPRNADESVFKLNTPQMNELDKKLMQMFIKAVKFVNPISPDTVAALQEITLAHSQAAPVPEKNDDCK